MTPTEALKLALSEEIKAIELYEKLNLKHSSLKEIFLFLINEEQKHKKLIENKITELTRY